MINIILITIQTQTLEMNRGKDYEFATRAIKSKNFL